jgi:hypothetical protein
MRMRISANTAGTASIAVRKNTAWFETKYPHAPMAAAATPLPMEAKRAFRPRRPPRAAWPTRPRLIAAITGPSTQLAPACNTRVAITTGNVGQIASASALTQIAPTASAATNRAERTASTSAPPGI